MIQTQTLAIDNDTRRKLIQLSKWIIEYRNYPELVKTLIAQHDEIIKRAHVCAYDPREEAKWVS